MTTDEKELLATVRIDVEDAMDRFLGNEDLYLKFLLQFPEDANFEQMVAFLEEGNVEEAFNCAHTIKGVAGNLSINGLYHVIIPFVEYLREGNLEEGRARLSEIKEVYDRSVAVIKKLA